MNVGTLKNCARLALNMTILDLRPDWSVKQIYPSGMGDKFVAFDPGQEILLPLKADVPDEMEECLDTIQVFATIGAPET